MANEERQLSDAVEDTFRRGGYGDPEPTARMPMVLPSAQGDTAINIFGSVVTAQRVAVKRVRENVRRELIAYAARMGDQYYYSIPFRKKDKRTGEITTEYVEGPTIVLANDLAREWGNCGVETRVVDSGGNWTFYSRFVDYETGYSLTRAFQQRKAQETGMKDEGRRLDMVFQIGQSKSQRNVVVNALQSLAQDVFAEAKKGLKERIGKEPEKARAYLVKQCGELAIDIKRIEEIYARSAANWTVADMSQIFAELRSISEGVAAIDDVYPPKGVEERKEPEPTKATEWRFITPQNEVVATTKDEPNLKDVFEIKGANWRVVEVFHNGDVKIEPQMEEKKSEPATVTGEAPKGEAVAPAAPRAGGRPRKAKEPAAAQVADASTTTTAETQRADKGGSPAPAAAPASTPAPKTVAPDDVDVLFKE
jgi:hypothetical protein